MDISEIPLITGGLQVQQKLRGTFNAMQSAQKTLKECYEVYKQVQSAQIPMDIYSRGRLSARIWELEQVFGQNRIFLSAAGQDRFIYETYFSGKSDGVYLEIGGYDGWTGSNCYFFEKTLGWKGIIVEASPTWVKEIPKYRNAEVIHAAISDRNGEAEFMDVISGATQMGGIPQHYIPSKLQQVLQYPGHAERRVTVPAMTLGALLDSRGLKHVDYCSIDVEGAEKVILGAVDFRQYDITVISVENAVGHETSSVKHILEPAGYRLVEVIGSDEIYVKNDTDV